MHDPHESSEEFGQLRELHKELDQRVTEAYGWTDVDLGHDFHTTKQGIRFTLDDSARCALLERLRELNHVRHEEESGTTTLEIEKTRTRTGGSSKNKSQKNTAQARLL